MQSQSQSQSRTSSNENKKRRRRLKQLMGSGRRTSISPTAVFLLAFVVLSASSSTGELSDAAGGDKRSAYDVLGDYNFPIGILPVGVRDYDLDSSSGKFAAFFNGTCSFSLEGSYQLQYKSTIKGVISENKLTNLQGVKVKILFVWVDIVEVRRSDDNLQFSVGIAGADFPIDNFFECPQCGCGLDCGGKKGSFRRAELVSSI